MSDGGAALALSGLSKSYGDQIAVRDLDLRVERAEIHGFLGRNGAGKTTTMKCLMGLLRWDSGTATFFDEPYHPGDIKARARIGYSPELPSYPAHLSGREVLEIYGRMRGIAREEARAHALPLLDRVMLSDAADKRVGKYSRGMQAKLGLAVALLGEPELLVLDEPTAGLDPVAASQVRMLFQELVREGASILLSSHQLAEVQQISDRVTVIDEGRKLIEGPVVDLLRHVQGGVVYRAELNLLPGNLEQEARALEDVTTVRVVEGSNKPAIELVLTKDWDVRESLARLAMKYGAVMLSCQRVEVPLETVFLDLVKDRTGPSIGR